MNQFILTSSLALFSATAGFGAAPRSASFEARHELNLNVPAGAKRVRVWFAMPQEDPAQQVKNFTVKASAPYRITTDSEGNKAVYLEITDPQTKELSVIETFTLVRREEISGASAPKAKALSATERQKLDHFLTANQHVVIDDRIRKLAAEVVGDEKNPLLAARKLYDWVLANIDYWVKDPKNKKASPVGSTEYCLSTKTGNCTDFHSLWMSLARAAGIPTRLVYGSFFKKELDGQDADQSYHCWPEFYASGLGWVPHDVAVADIFKGDFQMNADNEKLVRLTTGDGYTGADPSKVEYYFGNIDERRVTWSRGRDLTLSPKQDAGPVNALAKAYVEIDGKPAVEKEVWTRKLTFHEIKQ
jgi:transglutaminase-like putative cysteine protease